MRFEIERTRLLYDAADVGIRLLPPSSARCIRTARDLYSRILGQIEASEYDVFSSRARLPTWKKAAAVGRALLPGR
jgi:15-cis-phytoene synthase